MLKDLEENKVSNSCLRQKRILRWRIKYFILIIPLFTFLLIELFYNVFFGMSLSRHVFVRIYRNAYTQLVPAPTFNAQPANVSLVKAVKDNITILDSYISTRSGTFHDVHVLVKKGAEFTPVGIQYAGKASKLKLVTDLYCFRLGKSEIRDTKDPYYSYKKGASVAYGLVTPRGSSHSSTSGKFSLFVNHGEHTFLVKGLEVNGKCTWLVE